jgi:hypothetical protein
MPRFSVIVTERVSARYSPIFVEAEDYAAAAALVEARRQDGDLDDPSRETITDVSFEVAPIEESESESWPTDPQFCVTAAGRAAIEGAEG